MIEDILRAKINRCLDLLATSLQELSQMDQSDKVEVNAYYRVRNQVKEAKTTFEEVKKGFRRLFGPAPPYAPADYEKLRRLSLEKLGLIVQSEAKEQIVEELFQDELVNRFFSLEEVRTFVEKNFESQKKGKRKLANFKARLFYDKIQKELIHAEDLIKKIKLKAGLSWL